MNAIRSRNLEALGVERLAELLIEIGTGNAAVKRRLRLELASAQSPREAARQISKRLLSIARAKSFVTWQTHKSLADDLQTPRRGIVEQIAPQDPGEALSLLWRFMELAASVLERCNDSSDLIIDIFQKACANLGEIAKAAKPEPEVLAETICNALQEKDYGQYDDLIAIMALALGHEGIAWLKELVEEFGHRSVPALPKAKWKAVGRGTGGALYAHEMEERQRQSTVGMVLQYTPRNIWQSALVWPERSRTLQRSIPTMPMSPD